MMKLFWIIVPCLLFSCGVVKWQYPSKEVTGELNTMDILIRDCPEEMIINNFPMAGAKPNHENRYFIYKGEARQLNEFDTAWVRSHCNVTITTVN